MSVKIGVVFEKEEFNTTAVRTVDKAVEMINRRGDVLPGMKLIYTPIFYDGSSFNLGKTVCEEISDGVRAVVSVHVFCRGVSVQVVTAEWGRIPYACAGVGGT